ncbi:zinc-ribbon domain-containing protein [Paracoccus sp. p1-h21]|uniref:zinc-ribbon domain-containing protein n=1 Tax=Paracoccus sp. p1-h21 TaxID=3366951 RepID=UPI0037B8E01C
MRLICPECGAQYEIAADMVPAEGREVECSACGHVWHQPGLRLLAGAGHHGPAASQPVPEDGSTGAVADSDDTAGHDGHNDDGGHAADAPDLPLPKPRVSAAVLDILRAERAHEQAARQAEQPPETPPSRPASPQAKTPHDTPPVTAAPAASRPAPERQTPGPQTPNPQAPNPQAPNPQAPNPQANTAQAATQPRHGADAAVTLAPALSITDGVAGDSIADMDWPATTVTDPLPEADQPAAPTPETPIPETPDPIPTGAALSPQPPHVLRHGPAAPPDRPEEPRLAPVPRRQRDILDDPAMRRPGPLPRRRRAMELPDAEQLAATLTPPEDSHAATTTDTMPDAAGDAAAQPTTQPARPDAQPATDQAAALADHTTAQPPLPRKPARPAPPATASGRGAGNSGYHIGMTTALVAAFVLLASYGLAPLAGPDSALAGWHDGVDRWRLALFDHASAAVDRLIGR